MRTHLAVMFFLLGVVLAGFSTVATASSHKPIQSLKDVAGTWSGTSEDVFKRRSGYYNMTISEEGSYKGWWAYGKFEGKVWVEDGKLRFKRTDNPSITSTATVHETEGKSVLKGSRDDGSFKFEATLEK